MAPQGINSAAPTTAEVTGGVYNVTPPVLKDGQAAALQLDVNGKLITAGTASGATDVNIKNVSGATIGLTNPVPVELSDGTNPVGTSGNPLNDNIAQWGGATVAAAITTPPVGTERAPVVRNIVRKSSSILTSTPLGAGANFTSAWFDTTLDGTTFVEVCAFQDQTGNLFVIQETDDTSTTRTQTTAATAAGVPATGQNYTLQAKIAKKYWRVNFTNAGTIATITIITATTSNAPLSTGVTGTGDYTGNGVLVTNAVPVGIFGPNAAQDGIRGGAPTFINGQASLIPVGMMAWVGPGDAQNVLVRMPNVFKTVSATASGNTALWTPTSSKKFRLMRFIIDVTSNASQAAGGVITVSFQDAAGAIALAFDVFVPTTAVTTTLGGYTSGWIELGNGFLSALANNVLNVNLSAALATGTCRVTCCGTEE